ncbi:MAG: hemolysin family protein [Candidatus Omnitrophica bacterium]|nr:hemolysin family protein [Candidatus Omnitrophota bacterium]
MVNIILFIIFIGLSAFFSASETAIFSLSNLRLRRIKDRYAKAKILTALLRRPTHLLTTIVFGNMLVNIGLSAMATATFVKLFGETGLVFSIIVSGLLILLLGEIFPKTIAIYAAEKISLLSCPILKWISVLFFPFVFVIEKVVVFFSKLLLLTKKQLKHGEEELKTALLLGRRGGHITAKEEEMISYVLEFKDTWVGDIITARVNIVGINIDWPQETVLNILREKRHSKFPVYRDSMDNIVGILYAKDLFLNQASDYHSLIREPIFVPESKRLDDLLTLFRQKNERIAVVVDEYGGTQGLVTLEDIEEEIFGEIYDEYESKFEMIQAIDKNTYRVSGKAAIKNINIELGYDLPEEESTLAGFLLTYLERIPQQRERVVYKNIEFIIERATARRIVRVLIKR